MRSFDQARRNLPDEKDNEFLTSKEIEANLFMDARNVAEEFIENEYSEIQLRNFCSSLKKILYKQAEKLIELYYSEDDLYTSNSHQIKSNISNVSNYQLPGLNIVIPTLPPMMQGIPQNNNQSLNRSTITNSSMMNPTMMNPSMMNSTMMNPSMMNPSMMNPSMMNPSMMNPSMMNPSMMNPSMMNPTMMNHTMMYPSMMNSTMMNSTMMNPSMMNSVKSKKSSKKHKKDKKSKKEKHDKKHKEKEQKKKKEKSEKTSLDPNKYVPLLTKEYSGRAFDGILHELSNQNGGNIVNQNIISISGNQNSVYNVPTSSLVNYGTSSCYGSSNYPNSYLCFDFKSYAISLSAYSIRSSTYSIPAFLKTWVIEGSNDKSNWTIIDSHKNDSSLCERRVAKTFNVTSDQKDKIFRYIQLRCTGPSSRGVDQFEIQNIEFFGKYYYRES